MNGHVSGHALRRGLARGVALLCCAGGLSAASLAPAERAHTPPAERTHTLPAERAHTLPTESAAIETPVRLAAAPAAAPADAAGALTPSPAPLTPARKPPAPGAAGAGIPGGNARPEARASDAAPPGPERAARLSDRAPSLPERAVVLPEMARPAPVAAAAVRFLVMADRETVLSATTAGRVARLPVALGDRVRAGQVVAALDCAEVEARRQAARAEHEAARVQYEAKVRLQGLQSAAEVEVELAAANVDKARSQIRIFDAQIAQCAFVAPFAGKVARVHVKVGQGVTPGAPVIELVGSGPLEARMNVPSHWLAWLRPGATLSGSVDETGSAVTLDVKRIAGRVDAVSQTVEIEAQLAGGGDRVLPGMSGQLLSRPHGEAASRPRGEAALSRDGREGV